MDELDEYAQKSLEIFQNNGLFELNGRNDRCEECNGRMVSTGAYRKCSRCLLLEKDYDYGENLQNPVLYKRVRIRISRRFTIFPLLSKEETQKNADENSFITKHRLFSSSKGVNFPREALKLASTIFSEINTKSGRKRRAQWRYGIMAISLQLACIRLGFERRLEHIINCVGATAKSYRRSLNYINDIGLSEHIREINDGIKPRIKTILNSLMLNDDLVEKVFRIIQICQEKKIACSFERNSKIAGSIYYTLIDEGYTISRNEIAKACCCSQGVVNRIIKELRRFSRFFPESP